MSVQKIIVIAAAIALTVKLLQVILLVKRAGGELYGKPALPGFLVLFAKFAVVLPFAFTVINLSGTKIPSIGTSGIIIGFGNFLIFVATIFLVLSLDHLGRFTKMGLPVNDTIRLQTAGIYRISRNPMYLGLMLLSVGSIMMIPNILAIISGLSGIILHHLIILKEERFLKARFGQEYIDYQSKTRRYL